MICSQCSTENPDAARFCSGCGAPVLRSPDKQSDSVTTQPAAQYGSAPAAQTAALPQRQLIIAILSATLFLYCSGSTIGFTLYLLRSSGALGSIGPQLVGYLIGAILGAGIVMTTLRDRKAAITVLAGGILLRSATALLDMLAISRSAVLLIEWLLVGAAAAGLLWSIWKAAPVVAGDADRMRVALTILVGAEIGATVLGFVLYSAQFKPQFLLVSVLAIGALVWLRGKLPEAIGPAAAGAAPWSVSANPRPRRFVMLIVYVVIAVILRVILRQAFR